MDAGETEVSSLEAVGELFVVEAEEVGVVEHPALFEIEDTSGTGLIDILADFFEVAVEVPGGDAVAVPVGGVVKLHEAGAAFDEVAGGKAV